MSDENERFDNMHNDAEGENNTEFDNDTLNEEKNGEPIESENAEDTTCDTIEAEAIIQDMPYEETKSTNTDY